MAGEESRKQEEKRKAEAIAALEKHAEERKEDTGTEVNWRADLERDFRERPDALISSWCMIEMREVAKDHGFAIGEGEWPDPHDLPTFWYGEACLVARLSRVIVDDGSPTSTKQPGLFDWVHFADCAYADVLVTEDKRLSRLVQAASVPLKVISFTDWAHQMLRG